MLSGTVGLRRRSITPQDFDSSFIDRVSDGIVVFDTDWRYVAVNQAAARIAGLDRDTLIGARLWTFNPGEADSPLARLFERAMATQEVAEFEEYFSPAGRWLSGHIFPSPDGAMLVFIDSTQRHANERALRTLLEQLRRQRRLASVLAETNEVVFRATNLQQLLDSATRIVVELGGFLMCWVGELNPANGEVHPLAWAGQGAREYLTHLRVSTRPDESGQGIGGQALRSGTARFSNDVRLDDSMSAWRHMASRMGFRSVGGIPLIVNGRVRGLVAVYAEEPAYFNDEERDLLQRLAANVAYGWEALENEEALRQVREESERTARLEDLGMLAGGVAHDFNNLLGVILNYTTLVQRRVSDDSIREDLDAIRAAAERGGGLTRQLLTFASRDPTAPQTVDVNQALTSVVKLLEPVIGVGIDVSLDLHPNAPSVAIDPQQLDQVIVNLSVNARDAMPRGGRLTLSSRPRAEGGVEVSVTDTGIGMSDDVARRAFEPFFTTKPREHGTGLGLATVYGIVQRAGGQVAITSTPGLGTQVRVLLPEADISPSRPNDDVDDFWEGRGETILVVDDDTPLRESTARLLEEAGYHVLSASDGLAALEILHTPGKSIDLVLSDRAMPRMGGDQLAERIHVTHSHVPVVLMTGLTDEELESEVVLVKPLNETTLLRTLREVLRGH
jgi:PAS domain S-box-containing protein